MAHPPCRGTFHPRREPPPSRFEPLPEAAARALRRSSVFRRWAPSPPLCLHGQPGAPGEMHVFSIRVRKDLSRVEDPADVEHPLDPLHGVEVIRAVDPWHECALL